MTPLARLLTGTGVGRGACSASPNPQHSIPPVLLSAQVWTRPAETAITPFPNPSTATGVLLSVVAPSPSSPLELEPQHWTPPELVTAQVWFQPTLIEATPPR